MNHYSTTSNPPRITPVPDSTLGPPALVQAIAQRRGGTLLNLDRMLLRSPVFASGWNGFMGAIRTQLSLDPCLRELAICMVAVETDAAYEWSQHAPEFLAAGGQKLRGVLAPFIGCVGLHSHHTDRQFAQAGVQRQLRADRPHESVPARRKNRAAQQHAVQVQQRAAAPLRNRLHQCGRAQRRVWNRCDTRRVACGAVVVHGLFRCRLGDIVQS